MGLVAECIEGRGCVTGPLRSRKVADIMTSPAITVGEETTVEEIAVLLDGRGINRVPVVSADGRLRGIVSRGDVVRAESAAPLQFDFIRGSVDFIAHSLTRLRALDDPNAPVATVDAALEQKGKDTKILFLMAASMTVPRVV